MNELNIRLEQSWNTLDEAINYFLDLVLSLHASKRFPEQPTDIFLHVDGFEIGDDERDKLTITLTNL